MLQRLLFSVVIMVTLTSVSYGGFSFDLRLDQASYLNQAPNTTITSSVWLYQTANGADTNLTSAWTGSTGVKLNLAPTLGSGVTLTAASGNPAFNFSSQGSVNAGVATLDNSSFAIVAPANVGGLERRLLLGSVSFNSGLAGSNTTFSFQDFNSATASQDVTILNPGVVTLDSTIFAGSASIQITAVPEPASGALLAVAGLGALVLRRFRRKSNR